MNPKIKYRIQKRQDGFWEIVYLTYSEKFNLWWPVMVPFYGKNWQMCIDWINN